MINVTDFLDQVSAVTKNQMKNIKPRMGFIDHEFVEQTYPGHLPRVYIDGEGLSDRGYPCISSYLPMRGDRVVLFPVGRSYVILGTIDRTDRDILQPGQIVFRAVQTVAQSVPTSTLTPITFDTSEFDLIGGWSSSDNPSRYSPPVPGWYEFNGSVGFSTSSTAGGSNEDGWRSCHWSKNGSTIPAGTARYRHVGSSAANNSFPARTVPIEMDGSSDYVELIGEHNIGSSWDTTTSSAFVSNIYVKYVGPPASGVSPTQLNLE